MHHELSDVSSSIHLQFLFTKRQLSPPRLQNNLSPSPTAILINVYDQPDGVGWPRRSRTNVSFRYIRYIRSTLNGLRDKRYRRNREIDQICIILFLKSEIVR